MPSFPDLKFLSHTERTSSTPSYKLTVHDRDQYGAHREQSIPDNATARAENLPLPVGIFGQSSRWSST